MKSEKYVSPYKGIEPVPPSGVKEFGGKRYTFYEIAENEKKAQKTCEKLRASGYNARKTQNVNPISDRLIWVVWARKK